MTGTTLEDLLARGALPPRDALNVIGQLAGALDGARAERGRGPDIDPASVRVGRGGGGGRAVVEVGDDEPALQYMSPERIRGEETGPRSDVYSLSAVMYHCLTGAVPFPRGADRAVLFWHLYAPRPRPTSVRPELPPAIDRVLAQGMATDAAVRHPTPEALVEDARRALGGARRRRDAERQPRPAARRRRLLALGVLVAIAGGVAGYAAADRLGDRAAGSSPVSAGPLQLSVPAGWTPLATRAAPNLGLADGMAVGPKPNAGQVLVVGTAPPAASVALLSRLHAAPASGEVVALAGGAQARRYRADGVPGFEGRVTVYVAPTDQGIATVACASRASSDVAGFISRCERAAASLRLERGRFGPAGPSERQANGLTRLFHRLNAARSRYRAHNRRIRTAGGQARAARALARAHLRETGVVRSLRLSGLAEPGGRAAVRSLTEAARAYRALAGAAARHDRRRYGLARAAVAAADARMRSAIRALLVVGY